MIYSLATYAYVWLWFHFVNYAVDELPIFGSVRSAAMSHCVNRGLVRSINHVFYSPSYFLFLIFGAQWIFARIYFFNIRLLGEGWANPNWVHALSSVYITLFYYFLLILFLVIVFSIFIKIAVLLLNSSNFILGSTNTLFFWLFFFLYNFIFQYLFLSKFFTKLFYKLN